MIREGKGPRLVDRIRRLPRRAPIALAYCFISLSVFVSSPLVPALSSLPLYPSLVHEDGHLWQLVSYAVYPGSLGNFLTVSLFMLWFGWHLEPELGVGLTTLLYFVSAATGGLSYILLPSNQEFVLAGGVFVASATGAAFLAWTILNFRTHGPRFTGAWLLALCWVVLVVAGEMPLNLQLIHAILWVAGVATYLSLRVYRTRTQ